MVPYKSLQKVLVRRVVSMYHSSLPGEPLPLLSLLGTSLINRYLYLWTLKLLGACGKLVPGIQVCIPGGFWAPTNTRPVPRDIYSA